MALTTVELETLRDTLIKARYSGQRSVTYEGRSITWASDDELEAKIAALDRQLAGSTGTARIRSSQMLYESPV